MTSTCEHCMFISVMAQVAPAEMGISDHITHIFTIHRISHLKSYPNLGILKGEKHVKPKKQNKAKQTNKKTTQNKTNKKTNKTKNSGKEKKKEKRKQKQPKNKQKQKTWLRPCHNRKWCRHGTTLYRHWQFEVGLWSRTDRARGFSNYITLSYMGLIVLNIGLPLVEARPLSLPIRPWRCSCTLRELVFHAFGTLQTSKTLLQPAELARKQT
jgi:hypothetical protein